MRVWSLFIIGLMGLFFYNKIGSIIPMVVLPTTEIIEPQKRQIPQIEICRFLYIFILQIELLHSSSVV